MKILIKIITFLLITFKIVPAVAQIHVDFESKNAGTQYTGSLILKGNSTTVDCSSLKSNLLLVKINDRVFKIYVE